jgi:hypothetical protein
MRRSAIAITIFAALAAGSGIVLSAVPARAPARATVKAANTVALGALQNRLCRGEAPAGWIIADQDPNGTSFTLATRDRSTVAAYGIVGISSGHASGFYGPQFAQPSAFAAYLASVAGGMPVNQTAAPEPLGPMRSFPVQGNGVTGHVIYATYPLPADPGGYVISVRIALGRSAADARMAAAIAATISCTTALHSPSNGYAQVEAPKHDLATSDRCKSGDCDEGDLAGTYNAQLGTGYVHSASGENFLIDVTRDYSANGPQGPGYYHQVGNTLEKLEAGRSD